MPFSHPHFTSASEVKGVFSQVKYPVLQQGAILIGVFLPGQPAPFAFVSGPKLLDASPSLSGHLCAFGAGAVLECPVWPANRFSCARATVHGLVLRIRAQGDFTRVARARAVCRLGKVSAASLPQPTEAMEERSDRSSPLNCLQRAPSLEGNQLQNLSIVEY